MRREPEAAPISPGFMWPALSGEDLVRPLARARSRYHRASRQEGMSSGCTRLLEQRRHHSLFQKSERRLQSSYSSCRSLARSFSALHIFFNEKSPLDLYQGSNLPPHKRRP
jgi:hypothetical protein